MVVESYVVVHNIAKRHNVGTLARSATALGVSELILVGRRDFNSFGSHGSTSHLRFRHFHSLLDARNFLKEKDCDICGVEITDNAVAVNQHPFKRSTAFLLGNEGTGLSVKECEICDFFVYIPQYGGGTASLNVTVAASIVLHHFGVSRAFLYSIVERIASLYNGDDNCWLCLAKGQFPVAFPYTDDVGCRMCKTKTSKVVWAGFAERIREGNKFVVAERPAQQMRRNYCTETADSVIEERKIRRQNASNGFFDESESGESPSNLLDALFGD